MNKTLLYLMYIACNMPFCGIRH